MVHKNCALQIIPAVRYNWLLSHLVTKVLTKTSDTLFLIASYLLCDYLHNTLLYSNLVIAQAITNYCTVKSLDVWLHWERYIYRITGIFGEGKFWQIGYNFSYW